MDIWIGLTIEYDDPHPMLSLEMLVDEYGILKTIYRHHIGII